VSGAGQEPSSANRSANGSGTDSGPARALRWSTRLAGSVALGVALAAVAYFVFFVGSWAWLNLLVWAAVGCVVGRIARTWPAAVVNSAAVGFTIVLSYSIMGYQGEAPLRSEILPFSIIAVLGAVGMAVAGALGHLSRRRSYQARADR